MDKRALLAAALVLTVVRALAQSGSMTADQLKAYNSGRLTVDEAVVTSAVFGGFGALSLDTSRVWTGRQGFDRVSEARFYDIAGYAKESKKAAGYRTTSIVLLVGGGAAMAGGLLLSMLGATDMDYSDPDYFTRATNRLYGGLALTLGGAIPFWIGQSRIRKNWSSAEQAKLVAEEFNGRLAEKIKAD